MTKNSDTAGEKNKPSGSSDSITAGVDVGSVSTQAVIIRNNEIVSYSNIISGGNSVDASRQAMNLALDHAGLSLEDIGYVVSTGYGRVIVPFSNRNMSEVSCHGLGAHWYFPEGGLVLDMGGQDTKVIQYNDKGRVTHFSFSDKCAAGCGRYLEVMADLLGMTLESVNEFIGKMEEELPTISTSCVLFAKSEALGLVRQGIPAETIMAAYCRSLAHIIATQAERLGLVENLILTGGVAKNRLVVRSLEKWFGVKARICSEPQIIGALGAAKFARIFSGPSARA